MTPWIDTHVHLFPALIAEPSPDAPIPPERHSLARYLEAFGERPPSAAVIVHFSKAPDASHVIAALDAAAARGFAAKGILKADAGEARLDGWLQRADVAGIRFYAIESPVDLAGQSARWETIFNEMRQRGQHLLLFGKGDALERTIGLLPADLPLVLDHLGVPDVAAGAQGTEFRRLLDIARTRHAQDGLVFVKGPGYRTSLQPESAAPFVIAWAEALGESQLLLGASDAPFAGPVTGYAPGAEGKLFAEVIDHPQVLGYLDRLVVLTELDAAQVLFRNAAKLYRFDSAA